MSPPEHWSTVALQLLQTFRPEPRTEQDMTTDPESTMNAWHRRDPDDFHRAAAITADVCRLCEAEATEREEAK